MIFFNKTYLHEAACGGFVIMQYADSNLGSRKLVKKNKNEVVFDSGANNFLDYVDYHLLETVESDIDTRKGNTDIN